MSRDGSTARCDTDPLDALMLRVATGDEQSFDQLYRVAYRPVFGVIERAVHNPSLSAEIAQDVFVELWRCAFRYESSMGSVMAWVLTIARRRAIDRVRHEERSHARDTRYAGAHRETEVDVFDDVNRGLDADHVRSALRCLTRRQREAVELAYLHGYANIEIATRLNIPLATTKTRIRDGLLRLRCVLDDQSWLTAPHDSWSAAGHAGRRTQGTR
jgi:RNA polymerase sigma-70 factor (ECF subfamily)